ncbi:MAG TPA: glutamate--tRNA ligase family protein [Gemmatimonadales bacterium]|nr:glutamate--tRNA ligase family protein [Gemmatimonadales bacterium]
MPSLDLDRLRRRLPPAPLTRFAPSPTGYLHLGHAVNAVFVWGVARALGGRVLLRLEDHDRGRCRPLYETALFKDLEWLGLEPDVGTPTELRAAPSGFRQSDCAEVYERALARLASRQLVYACGCSRRSLAPEADMPDGVEVPYSGRCRNRGLPLGPGRGVRVPLGPGTERFEDGLLGWQEQEPETQCGDLLLRDRLGNWTYQFAVTVDDQRHGVDLVVRGADLLGSTGRQIRVAGLLGRTEPPVFLHHPLLFQAAGQKLSKASHDTGLRELRAGGAGAAEVLGEAAFRAGLLPRRGPVPAAMLGGLFG